MICINRDREYLATDHLDLVDTELRLLMSRPRVRSLGWDDGYGAGSLALVESAATYDFRKDCSFRTYASRAIRRAILRASRREIDQELPCIGIEPEDRRVASTRDLDLEERMLLLSEREHAAVHLRSLQGLPWSAVAERMQTSPQNAARFFNSAVRKMKKKPLDETVFRS